MINGKHGQEAHSTKIGADKLAKNIPNVPKFNVYLPHFSAQPQKFFDDFDEKKLHWASVVRGSINKDTNLLISFVDIVTNSWSESPMSFRWLIGFDKRSS